MDNSSAVLRDLEQVYTNKINAKQVKKPAPFFQFYIFHKRGKWQCKNRVTLHKGACGIAAAIMPIPPADDDVYIQQTKPEYGFAERVILNKKHTYDKENSYRGIN